MMLRFLLLLCFCCTLLHNAAAQHLVKQYFFGSEDFFSEQPELVLIVDRPQTELAREIGSRYYADTAFLQQMASEFYKEIDTSDHTISSTYCGYDMYFYVKHKQNLRLWRALNSDCTLDELGSVDDQGHCRNLEALKASGIPLEMDTLCEQVPAHGKDSILEGLLYYRDVELDMNRKWRGVEYPFWSGDCNAQNLPAWYYDGSAEVKLPLDSTLTVKAHIERYLADLGIADIQDKAINWRISPRTLEKIQLHELLGVSPPQEIPITFYFSADYFSYFDFVNIRMIDVELYTDFEGTSRCLLLYKIPEE